MERRISESGEELCTVCSEVMHIYAFGECHHPICHKCATRMRVLCEHMYCAICRKDLAKIAFTKNLCKFGDLNLKQFKMHQKYNIFFENDLVRMAFFEVQEHKCQLCKDIKPFKSFASLRDHMKKEHTRFPCEICVKHVKLFSSERKFYDRKSLAIHRRNGDEDDRSHKGHPLCKFCDERYLDNDELVRHLRKDHFFCHFCDADGISNQFYGDYSYLREHFMESHYLCEEGDCVNVQFTNAFRYELDLKAHVAAVHSKNLKRAMAKAARTLDVDINLAPRKFQKGQNKGKGVIGPEDYSEVSSSQQNQSVFGRGKNLRFLRDRRQKEREAEEMSRAITASLNSATQNSVSVVDSNLLRPDPEEPPPPKAHASSKYNSQDFPDLAASETVNRNSDSDDNQKASSSTVVGDSLAKKVARSKGLNVQDGGMKEEDFPSLGPGQANKVWLQAAKGPSGWQNSEDFPDLGGGAKPRVPQAQPTWTKSSQKAQTQSFSRSSQSRAGSLYATKNSRPQSSHTAKTGAASDPGSTNDFPSLSSIGLALNKGMSSGSATDALTKYSQAGVNSGVQHSNVRIVESKPEKVPTSSSFTRTMQVSSNDFPTLQSKTGGNSKNNKDKAVTPGQMAWGPKSKPEKVPEKPVSAEENSRFLKMKKKSKNVRSGLNGFGSMSSEDSNDSLKNLVNSEPTVHTKEVPVQEKPENSEPLNSKVISEKILSQKDTKVTKKKKSKAAIEDIVDNSDSGSQTSLTGGKKKKKKSKAEKKSNDSNTKEGASEKSNENTTNNTSTSVKDNSVLRSTENLSQPLPEASAESLDFPSIHDSQNGVPLSSVILTSSSSNSQIENCAPQAVTDKFQANVASEDDFPVLGGFIKSHHAAPPPPPPPGLTQSNAPPPPGFNIKPTAGGQKNPPPGFTAKPTATSNLANIALLLSSNEPTVSQPEVRQEAEGLAVSSDGLTSVSSYSYLKPDDFESRNQKLISDVMLLLQNDQERFRTFKKLSGDFRKDLISATDYYQQCSEVIGNGKFSSIFTELLVLLPDIVKQQNLLSAHRSSASRKGVGKKGKGWNTAGFQDFAVCSECKQVLLAKELSGHHLKHTDNSDFPALGAS